MKITTRDWIFIAVIAVVLGLLFMNSGRVKVKRVPYDTRHNGFYEAMQHGGDRRVVEKGCGTCHGMQMPLPKAHPPKEQCLVCHKLSLLKK